MCKEIKYALLAGQVQGYQQATPAVSVRQLASAFALSKSKAERLLKYKAPLPRANFTKAVDPGTKNRRRIVGRLARATEKDSKGIDYPKFPSAKSIVKELAAKYRITASPRTVQRDLERLGLRSFVRKRVPSRDPKVLRTRYAFCKALKKKDIKNIFWSDEHIGNDNDTSCRTMYATSREFVIPRESKNPRNAASFQVWGAIGPGGFKSKLVFFPKTKDEDGKTWRLNADKYKKKCLIPFINKDLKDANIDHKDVVFMQDGARSHIAKVVKKYCADKGLKLLENWPPHSPDLNPIENVWSLMNERVAERHPVGESELKACLQSVWDELTAAEINKLCDSFWGRTRRCMALKGGYVSKM